jgi:putative nucleotidyltransferase with HDIG domain
MADPKADKVKRAVLVVDDEPDICVRLQQVLLGAGYESDVAASVAEAQEKINSKAFDLVVSDIRMPDKMGTELLAWALTKHPALRFIMMTGFSEMKALVDASAANCRSVLMKPASSEAFLTAVNSALIQAQMAVFEEGKFASITISEFLSPATLEFSLYVKASDGHFIHIAKPGDIVPRDKLLALREKSINELWLEIKDFNTYREKQFQVSKAMAKSSGVQVETKLKMFKAATELAAENMRVMGMTKETLQESMQVMEDSIGALMDEEISGKLVKILENQNETLYGHSVTCSIIAGAFAKIVGWSSKKNIQTFVSGAFLHDIGLYKIPENLQLKNYDDMNEEERKVYEQHSALGAELLTANASVAPEVIQIVHSHHEHPNGSGYPRRLLKSDIYPLARTVALIDAFVDGWGRLPEAERRKKGAVGALLGKITNLDPMAFDKSDAVAVKLAMDEPNLVRARALFDKERYR